MAVCTIVRASDRVVESTRHGPEIQKQVILREGVLPNVTQAAIAVLAPHTHTEPHKHDTMYEVYFCLQGSATYMIGGEAVEVHAGDFFWVPPDTIHWQKTREQAHIIFYWGISVD